MTVEFLDLPWAEPRQRVTCQRFPHDCWRVTARFGFMEQPDVAHALELCGPHGLQLEPMDVSYFLSREKIVPAQRTKGLVLWRDRVFSAMARNAGSITDFFNIPANRVVELGTRVEL
jgi:KUP system potassium uptake protein